MSGVQVGTRLDLLERLRVKIDQEIAVERRKLALNGPGPRARFDVFEKPKRKAPEPAAGERLIAELGVTTRDVKVWAVSVGLLDQVRRGRVAGSVVDAYALAHRPQADDGALDHCRCGHPIGRPDLWCAYCIGIQAEATQ